MLLNTFSGSFRVKISSQYYYLMNTSTVILNSSYSEENVEYNVIIVANVPKKVVARVSFYLIKSKNTPYHQIITVHQCLVSGNKRINFNRRYNRLTQHVKRITTTSITNLNMLSTSSIWVVCPFPLSATYLSSISSIAKLVFRIFPCF